MMKVAILGGGSGAHAMAADLALAGHEIRLAELPAFEKGIAAIRALKGITLDGMAPMGGTPGFAPIAMATTDIRAAVLDADLVMVVVPAYGHEAFMRELAVCAAPDQVIVFHSGYFAAPVFARLLAEVGRAGQLLFGETASLIYQARLRWPGRVLIRAAKRQMLFATLPAQRTNEALSRIHRAYPQFVAAQNVFETSTSELGVMVHPVTTLLNLSRIEHNGPYKSHYYEMTPGVGRVMDAVDAERQAVQRGLGLPGASLPEMLEAYFGAVGANCYEAILACPNYSTQTTPDSLQHRYLTEDVPFGLVPIAELGSLVGVDTIALRMLIQLAGLVTGEDFYRLGRTAAKMGFEGMSREELLHAVS
jgi:opine dehydrogenase